MKNSVHIFSICYDEKYNRNIGPYMSPTLPFEFISFRIVKL